MHEPPAFLSKKDYLVRAIRDQILNGEIRPGDQLLQRELAERFNTSVTPVREALMQLESEGLITYETHRGATVVSIRAEDAVSICLIRADLEELALEWAFPNITPERILSLRGIQQQVETALLERDLIAVRKLNRSFHHLIYELANSPILLDVAQYVWNKFPWDVLPAVYHGAENSIHQHRDLLDHLETRDLDAAKAVMRAHILAWAEFVRQYLMLPDPQADGAPARPPKKRVMMRDGNSDRAKGNT